MLRNLLKPRIPVFQPKIPDGRRIYAVGDVHGCLDLLDRLLAAIDADSATREPADTTLIFLGDLIDRGPASYGVVERVRRLAERSAHVHLLTGNHEELFLAALDGDARALKLFCRVGGRETAISYGIAPDRYESLDYEELAAVLTDIVPAEHRAFLASGEDMIEIGDYLFVHAGIHPGRALDDQRTTDLRWIRDTFLEHRKPLARMIVHGHTIAETVEFRPHRIGIDTGAYVSGRLTALGLEADRTWVIDTAS